MTIDITSFDIDNQVTTTLKYHGKNRFYLPADLVRALVSGELDNGDEMVIKILAVNRFKTNGDGKQ